MAPCSVVPQPLGAVRLRMDCSPNACQAGAWPFLWPADVRAGWRVPALLGLRRSGGATDREGDERHEQESKHMNRIRQFHLSTAAAVGVAVLLAMPVAVHAQGAIPAVAIGNVDIGGVVTGQRGPEAGVWVIAETTDLPTRF